MRIGHGYDVHRFCEGDGVCLGGVKIPHTHGLLAHSDGDVLLHALCDALLGAAGLGDIGRHFPDDDPRYRGIDSRHLLREVGRRLQRAGLSLHNADMTVLAEQPRLSPHVRKMGELIADDLGVEPRMINVKATTTETLGFVGRQEGIAAHAVVLLNE